MTEVSVPAAKKEMPNKKDGEFEKGEQGGRSGRVLDL